MSEAKYFIGKDNQRIIEKLHAGSRLFIYTGEETWRSSYWQTGKRGGVTNIPLHQIKSLEEMGIVTIKQVGEHAEPTLTEVGKSYVAKPQTEGLDL